MKLYTVIHSWGYDCEGRTDNILAIKQDKDEATKLVHKHIGAYRLTERWVDKGAPYDLLHYEVVYPTRGDYEYYVIVTYELDKEY